MNFKYIYIYTYIYIYYIYIYTLFFSFFLSLGRFGTGVSVRRFGSEPAWAPTSLVAPRGVLGGLGGRSPPWKMTPQNPWGVRPPAINQLRHLFRFDCRLICKSQVLPRKWNVVYTVRPASIWDRIGRLTYEIELFLEHQKIMVHIY